MNGTDADSNRQPMMLSAAEVASILRCSPRTVYRLVDSGKMPGPCRLGGLVRWNGDIIRTWIAEGCPTSRKGPGR